MNALTRRANYRKFPGLIDWLLLAVLVALPIITAYAAFQWAIE